MSAYYYTFTIVAILLVNETQGAFRRCFTCRSRGDLGTCRDPFTYNSTDLDKQHGIETIPCASGWCSKIVEGKNTFSATEYGMATERQCLPRGPSDSEERCDYTEWNHRKVYLCMCKGDLCNGSNRIVPDSINLLLLISLSSLMVQQLSIGFPFHFR